MMAKGRDSFLMRKTTLFTKQVQFYACKNQIKPKLYPLLCDRKTARAHHHYRTANISSVAKLNLFSRSGSGKTAELSASRS